LIKRLGIVDNSQKSKKRLFVNSIKELSTMPSQNNNNSSEKKNETKARVEEIAETLLSLLPKGEEVNLDTIENTLTPILNAIRKRATERHFEEQESSEYHCPVCPLSLAKLQ